MLFSRMALHGRASLHAQGVWPAEPQSEEDLRPNEWGSSTCQFKRPILTVQEHCTHSTQLIEY